MRLVTFRRQDRVRLGAQVFRDGVTYIIDLNRVQPDILADLLLLLRAGASALERAREASTSTDESH